MNCIHFLVFLLGLLPLPTLTTAEQYGGATPLDNPTLPRRFCLRGPRTRFLNHPPESMEKYLEKSPTAIDASAEDTTQAEKTSEDEERNPTTGKVASTDSKGMMFQDKASDYVKTEEANKYYKTAAAPAPAPSKAKISNLYEFEDLN